MTESLFVGIDVSQKSNVVAFHSTTGELKEPAFTIPNNQLGIEALIGRLHRYLTATPDLHVIIGCEATGIYSYHLLQALASAEPLASFDLTLYQLNPKLVHHFRKVLNEQQKTDLVDASVIAERLRFFPPPGTIFSPATIASSAATHTISLSSCRSHHQRENLCPKYGFP